MNKNSDKIMELLIKYTFKNIKTFDGTDKHSSLEDFLSSCQEAFDYLTKDDEIKQLLKFIMNTKLEGIASTYAKRKIIKDFEDFKIVLNQKFKIVLNQNVKKQSCQGDLIIQLSQIKQKKKENALPLVIELRTS